MIALTVFWILLTIGCGILGINVLTALLEVAGIHLVMLDKIFGYLRKFGFMSLAAALLVLVLGSITPYILNERDAARIESYNANIVLYNGYIQEYTDAAQKQIEQYQKMQAEMARTATSTQLQFFSQQVDAVGNALTNRIKEFKDDIMKEQLDTNKTKAQINSRSRNKWFFWDKLTIEIQ
jgi:hypothetical protein